MSLRRELGFWNALGSLRVRQLLFTPEFAAAIAIGAGGSFGLLFITTMDGRREIASDYLLLLGPLVGVVLAALALVIALMTDAYLRLLNESRDGVLTFVRPFIITIGLQVTALIGAVAYRAAAPRAPHRLEEALFVGLSFLFV